MKASILVSWVTLGTAAVVAVACGGDDITCGPGTKQNGEQCVAAAGGASGSGSGGTGATDGGTVGPSFEGVVSLAPASDVSLQVTWNPASDTVTAPEEMKYRVYVATAAGEQNFGVPTAESPEGVTSLVVGDLTPGAMYHVVVRAVNSADVEDSNTKELSKQPEADAVAPTFGGIKATKTVGATAVEVSWDPANDDKTPPEGMGYAVFWATTANGAPSGNLGKLSIPGATSVVVDDLPDPEQEYFFTVRARDAAGNGEENVVALAGSTGPDVAAPTYRGCVATGQPGATNATLSWEPARDDTTLPEDVKYNVYAFEEPVDEDTAFGAPAATFVGGTSGLVTTLKQETTYYFVCRAEDASGNEDTNLVFRVLKTLEDGEPPNFGGLTGVVEDSTFADLSWGPADDDKTAEADIVYLVYQSESPNTATDSDFVARSEPGATGIRVLGLKSSTPYYWVVRAQDKAQNIDQNKVEVTRTTLVSFANDIQPIFTANCAKTGCHGPPAPMQGLDLQEGFAYAKLFNVVAANEPSFKRVEPGDPQNSYIIIKLEGRQTVGARMPREADALDPAVIATIRQWIQQGAKQN